MVDAVISWDDSDESACGAIAKCLDISSTVVFVTVEIEKKETHLK